MQLWSKRWFCKFFEKNLLRHFLLWSFFLPALGWSGFRSPLLLSSLFQTMPLGCQPEYLRDLRGGLFGYTRWHFCFCLLRGCCFVLLFLAKVNQPTVGLVVFAVFYFDRKRTCQFLRNLCGCSWGICWSVPRAYLRRRHRLTRMWYSINHITTTPSL